MIPPGSSLGRIGLALSLVAAICSAVGPSSVSAAPGCTDPGSMVPVIFIHGFTGQGEDWKTTPVYKAVQSTHGFSVDVFDYHQVNTKWVTDDGIGPALADRIVCLAEASAKARGPGRVVAIGHSMGGLAIREAASLERNGHKVADRIGLVLTVGTPNTGSWFGSVALGGRFRSETERAVFLVLVSGCGGADVPVTKEDSIACWLVKMGSSDAAKAMRTGSDELAALSSSHPFAVLAMAADIEVATTIFDHKIVLGSVGDLIVDKSSALAISREEQRGGGTFTHTCTWILRDGDPEGVAPCWHRELISQDWLVKPILTSLRTWMRSQSQFARSPEDAARGLWGAWAKGDRGKAALFGSATAVAALFDSGEHPETWSSFAGCDDTGIPGACRFDPSFLGFLWMHPQRVGSTYRINRVEFYYGEADFITIGPVTMDVPSGWHVASQEADFAWVINCDEYCPGFRVHTGQEYERLFGFRDVGSSFDKDSDLGWWTGSDAPVCSGMDLVTESRLVVAGLRPFGSKRAEYPEWAVRCAGGATEIVAAWILPVSHVLVLAGPIGKSELAAVNNSVRIASFG